MLDDCVEKRRAFLDLMLLSNKEGVADFSDTEIRNEVDTFMFEVGQFFDILINGIKYSKWIRYLLLGSRYHCFRYGVVSLLHG